MKDIDKGIAIGMLMGKKKEAKLGTKTATQNGTYTASSESPALDGYSEFTVSVPIESATFTDNGTYTAQNGGYNPVIVDVDTYEDEYQALLQCSQQVAAAVGAITGTVPQDCSEILDAVTNDIPEIIAEKEEEIEEYEECCDDVKEAVGLDPQDPSITPQDVVDAVIASQGYEFPAGTAYDPDIISIVGGDNVTDETLGYTLYSEIGMNYDPQYQAWHNPYIECGMIDSNGVYHHFWGNAYGSAAPMFQVESYCVTNSATGEWTITYIDPYGRRQTNTGTSQDLIGFGDAGHTYKVHKSVPKNV